MYQPPIHIPFYPKFFEEGIDIEERLTQYREWLEGQGDYGRLFMWEIGKPPKNPNADIPVTGGPFGGNPYQAGTSSIIGVKIYDHEVGTLFKLMHEV